MINVNLLYKINDSQDPLYCTIIHVHEIIM